MWWRRLLTLKPSEKQLTKMVLHLHLDFFISLILRGCIFGLEQIIMRTWLLVLFRSGESLWELFLKLRSEFYTSWCGCWADQSCETNSVWGVGGTCTWHVETPNKKHWMVNAFNWDGGNASPHRRIGQRRGGSSWEDLYARVFGLCSILSCRMTCWANHR